MASLKNQSGAVDTTAYSVMTKIEAEDKRANKAIYLAKMLLDLCGYELVNRLEIRDKRTRRVYR